MLLQQCDIRGPPYKGKPNHIRLTCNEFQIDDVLSRQTNQIELAIRQVDTLVGQQFFSTVARLGDFNQDLAGSNAADHAADAAIVDQDAFTGVNGRKDLR
jgi:hypothetical protein